MRGIILLTFLTVSECGIIGSGEVPECFAPRLENGWVESQSGLDSYRFVGRLKCQPGYVLTGEETIKCWAGVWSQEIPSCTAIQSCNLQSLPRIRNGFRRGVTQLENSVYRYKCYSGYTLVGPSTIYCRGNQWSTNKSPMCAKSGCDKNRLLEQGIDVHRQALGSNGESVYRFKCDAGSVLIGNPLVYCDGQNWSSAPPQCQVPPQPPLLTLYNGDLIQHTPLLQMGDNVTLHCQSRGGNPRPKLEFLVNNQPFTDAYVESVIDGSISLSLTASPELQGSQVSCTASNDISSRPVFSQFMLIRIQFGPNKCFLTGPSLIEAGQKVDYVCRSEEADPAPELFVTAKDQSNTTLFPVSKKLLPAVRTAIGWESQLMISYLVSPGVKRIEVQCRAVNRIGEAVSYVTTQVAYGPTAVNVHGPSHLQSDQEGLYTCSLSPAYPEPSVTWIRQVGGQVEQVEEDKSKVEIAEAQDGFIVSSQYKMTAPNFGEIPVSLWCIASNPAWSRLELKSTVLEVSLQGVSGDIDMPETTTANIEGNSILEPLQNEKNPTNIAFIEETTEDEMADLLYIESESTEDAIINEPRTLEENLRTNYFDEESVIGQVGDVIEAEATQEPAVHDEHEAVKDDLKKNKVSEMMSEEYDETNNIDINGPQNADNLSFKGTMENYKHQEIPITDDEEIISISEELDDDYIEEEDYVKEHTGAEYVDSIDSEDNYMELTNDKEIPKELEQQTIHDSLSIDNNIPEDKIEHHYNIIDNNETLDSTIVHRTSTDLSEDEHNSKTEEENYLLLKDELNLVDTIGDNEHNIPIEIDNTYDALEEDNVESIDIEEKDKDIIIGKEGAYMIPANVDLNEPNPLQISITDINTPQEEEANNDMKKGEIYMDEYVDEIEGTTDTFVENEINIDIEDNTDKLELGKVEGSNDNDDASITLEETEMTREDHGTEDENDKIEMDEDMSEQAHEEKDEHIENDFEINEESIEETIEESIEETYIEGIDDISMRKARLEYSNDVSIAGIAVKLEPVDEEFDYKVVEYATAIEGKEHYATTLDQIEKNKNIAKAVEAASKRIRERNSKYNDIYREQPVFLRPHTEQKEVKIQSKESPLLTADISQRALHSGESRLSDSFVVQFVLVILSFLLATINNRI